MNNECDRDPLGFQPHLPGTHVATWRSLLQKDAVSNSMEYRCDSPVTFPANSALPVIIGVG